MESRTGSYGEIVFTGSQGEVSIEEMDNLPPRFFERQIINGGTENT